MSNPIVTFLEGRKQKPLKEGKKPAAEIESDYSTLVWVANAAQRASQLSLVSHPAKFSHPDARATPVLYVGNYTADGFLRSGNAWAGQDVVGNAAALDVYAFLTLSLDDGQSVLQHFEAQTPHLKGLLGADEITFQVWRHAFLQIKKTSDGNTTHPNVKQVYFPLKEGYHLLSVLYPSGLMTEHRERLRTLKFSEATKLAREARKKGDYHAEGFADMAGMLTQHFGGTKPQNVSKLNSNNGGEAWLLPCFPPELESRYQRLPKTDFFKTLYAKDKDLQDLLAVLHKLFVTGYNNIDIRDARKRLMAQVFEWILTRAMRLQLQPAGWSSASGFELPLAQQLWLDSAFLEKRNEHDLWQEEIAAQVSDWFLYTYRRSRQKDDAADLGTTEANAFQNELIAYFRQQQGFIQ